MLRTTFLLMVLFVLLAGCAPKKTPLPTDNIDELLGTWANTKYDRDGNKDGKVVWKADGTASIYRSSTYDRSFTDPRWIVKEKWKTANGAVYFVVFLDFMGSHAANRHFTIRLSPDRSYYEHLIHIQEAPVEIEPNEPEYCIYYRQE
jgi:hypothetical protein